MIKSISTAIFILFITQSLLSQVQSGKVIYKIKTAQKDDTFSDSLKQNNQKAYNYFKAKNEQLNESYPVYRLNCILTIPLLFLTAKRKWKLGTVKI